MRQLAANIKPPANRKKSLAVLKKGDVCLATTIPDSPGNIHRGFPEGDSAFLRDPVGFIAHHYGQLEMPRKGRTFTHADVMQCPICLGQTLHVWEPVSSTMPGGEQLALSCDLACPQTVIKDAIALRFDADLPYDSTYNKNTANEIAGEGWEIREHVRQARAKAAEVAEPVKLGFDHGSAILEYEESMGEMLSTAKKYAVEGMLPSRGIAIMTGEGGIGKSFLATALLVHWGAGGSFFGRGIGAGAAIYLDYEGSKYRMAEATWAAGMQYPEIKDRVLYRYANHSLPRLGGDVNSLLESLQHKENFPNRGDLGLVVVDSLTAAYDAEVDEHSASSVETVMAQLREIVEYFDECCVLVLAHPSKTGHLEAEEAMRKGKFPFAARGTVRGSTRLWDASDMVLFAARAEATDGAAADTGAPPAVLLATVKDRKRILRLRPRIAFSKAHAHS